MPEKIADRYITLSGDKPYTPLRKAFFQAADFKAGLMASGLGFAYYGQKDPDPASAVGAVIAIFTINTLIAGLVRVYEKFHIHSPFKNENLCIDTQPDKDTPLTKPEHLVMASRGKFSYAALGTISLVMDSYRIATGVSVVDTVLFRAAECTRCYQGYERYDKIIKGDWVIVDMPPIEKVMQKETQKSREPGLMLPVPSLTP